MIGRRLTHRLAALGLLAGGVATAVLLAWGMAMAYTAGQREIVERRAELRNLRDLGEARTAFAHLAPHGKSPGFILPADANAEATLASAVAHAADGQQVIVDGIDPVETGPVTRTAVVHLRGTQAGIYDFLRTVEEQVPYMLVPRLELTPARAADPEHGKPFVLGADLRLALLVAPEVKSRKPAAPAEATP